ncbi:hypothetical protein J6590_084895 [Homalodisca vitripennis]|nr:hypothetical protein J6590_084895 [Homalodisca vitripennis]
MERKHRTKAITLTDSADFRSDKRNNHPVPPRHNAALYRALAITLFNTGLMADSILEEVYSLEYSSLARYYPVKPRRDAALYRAVAMTLFNIEPDPAAPWRFSVPCSRHDTVQQSTRSRCAALYRAIARTLFNTPGPAAPWHCSVSCYRLTLFNTAPVPLRRGTALCRAIALTLFNTALGPAAPWHCSVSCYRLDTVQHSTRSRCAVALLCVVPLRRGTALCRALALTLFNTALGPAAPWHCSVSCYRLDTVQHSTRSRCAVALLCVAIALTLSTQHQVPLRRGTALCRAIALTLFNTALGPAAPWHCSVSCYRLDTVQHSTRSRCAVALLCVAIALTLFNTALGPAAPWHCSVSCYRLDTVQHSTRSRCAVALLCVVPLRRGTALCRAIALTLFNTALGPAAPWHCSVSCYRLDTVQHSTRSRCAVALLCVVPLRRGTALCRAIALTLFNTALGPAAPWHCSVSCSRLDTVQHSTRSRCAVALLCVVLSP